MSEEIKVSDEARECAENEADAYLCGRELGHHVQSLLTHRDEEIAELRKDKARLDFLVSKTTRIEIMSDENDSCGWRTFKPLEGDGNAREIIDAAMSKDAKSS